MKKTLKKLLKYFGIIVSIILLIIGIIALIAYTAIKKQNNIPDNSILELYLSANPQEKSQTISSFETMILGESPPLSLRKNIELIKKAATDDKIKAICINGKSYIGHTSAIELSEAIQEFKSNGKEVIAYGDYYTQSGYMLSSFADSIFINPTGQIDLKGYVIILSYFKKFLDKFNIDMEVFVAGKYKSFVEMYQRTKSSPHNEKQYRRYIEKLEDELFDVLSENRGVSKNSLEDIFKNNKGGNATSARDLALVDSIMYKTDFENHLKEKYELDDKFMVSMAKYNQYVSFNAKKKKKKPNVAFVVIEGGITDNASLASTTNLRKTFKEIREDDNIKTVILRLNSPGGSATASEEIWHEIELTKAKGKKVISSVASVAGSGGYYVMCNSDKIFANRSSLTGSIGAFTAVPVFGPALETNIGITFDEISTGPFANRAMGYDALNNEQRAYYQNQINVLYKLFMKRVSEGRNLQEGQIDSIAQGKVYITEDALNVQLVDSVASLNGVLEYVKNSLSDELILEEYPKVKAELFPKPEFVINVKSEISLGNILDKSLNDQFEEIKSLLNTPIEMMRMDFFSIK